MFLDINDHENRNKSETKIQCKSTFSGGYTNSRSLNATEYNVAWFLHCNRKGLTIVSDYHKLQEEIVKLISVLKQNGYAKWFLFTKYRSSLPQFLKIH